MVKSSLILFVPVLIATQQQVPEQPAPCVGDLLQTEGVVEEICVTEWRTSNASEYQVDNTVLLSVNLSGYSIGWEAYIRWPAYENGVAGRIWAFWSEDGGKTYTGFPWDWLGNERYGHKSFGPLPGEYIGTMLSTAYGAAGVVCGPQCETVRSNIIMSKNENILIENGLGE